MSSRVKHNSTKTAAGAHTEQWTTYFCHNLYLPPMLWLQKKLLVLTFSVVGSATGNRGGDKQIVEPVAMIDPTIELVSGRDVVLPDLRPWAIRPEIMKQGPGSYL